MWLVIYVGFAVLGRVGGVVRQMYGIGARFVVFLESAGAILVGHGP